MKALFATLLLASFAFVAQAQKAERLTFAALPIDSTTHLVTYTAVVPVQGATKEQLYLRAKEWAARTFQDSKTAVRMDDKEAGTYITRGIVPVSKDGQYGVMLAVYTKDGRYKYVVDQLTYTYSPSNNMIIGVTNEAAEKWVSYGKMNARYVDKRVRETQELANKLIANLQAAMSGNASATKSDW